MRPGSGGSWEPDLRLVDAYEEMRRWAGGEGAGRAGYEVLRRQGLAAWIEAFLGCVGAAPSPRAARAPPCGASTPGQRRAGGALKVPEHLYAELTEVLAGLALGQLGEGVC